MTDPFFLASHDYVSSPAPRECSELARVTIGGDMRGREFLLVNVSPPLPKHLTEAGEEIRQLLLAPCTAASSLRDIGNRVVMVDLYVTWQGTKTGLTARDLTKIGTGTVHATLAEATEFFPVD